MWNGTYTALITPFKPSGDIDFVALERLIHRQIEGSVSGLVLLGSTGEAALLEVKERLEVVECAADLSKDTFPLIVGISSPSTQESLEFGEAALRVGADALMSTPPYYVKPTFAGIKAHFSALSELGAPLMVYNHPGRTGIDLSSHELEQLARIESVEVIKDSSSSFKSVGIPVFCGDDIVTREAVLEGGYVGSVSVIANAYPLEWSTYVAGLLEGKNVQNPLKEIIEEISQLPNPAGIKALLAHLNLCENQLRLPLLPERLTERIVNTL